MALRLSRRKQFAIEQEANEGVAETLVAADVQFEVEELSSTFTNDMAERRPLRSSLSPVPMIPGIRRGEITGRVELVGGGDASTRPPTADVLRACGYRELVVHTMLVSGLSGTFTPGEQITDGGSKEGRYLGMLGASTVVYALVSGTNFAQTDSLEGSTSGATATIAVNPAAAGYAYMPDSSDDIPSFTVGVNNDGVLTTLYGARGTASIEIEGAGRLAYLNFTLQGAANVPVDAPLWTGLTLPAVTPETFLSAALEIQNVALCVNRLSADLGNQLAPRLCANESNGIKAYRITDRQPTLSVEIEAPLEDDWSVFSNYDGAVRMAFEATVGTTAGKRVRLVAPRSMITEMPYGDREGILTHDLTLSLTGDQPEGDDEFIIAFY